MKTTRVQNLLAAALCGLSIALKAQTSPPAGALKLVTHDNAQLLTLSGPRNPYPGKLGVIEEGALADLLLVDGDPLANYQLVADPANSFVVIMKDGKIYKNLIK